jgi:hypothetical protein
MRRLAAIGLVAAALAGGACSMGTGAQPTPRPSGQRGSLLNPIDRTQNTVNQLNQQQNREEQQTSGGAGSNGGYP